MLVVNAVFARVIAENAQHWHEAITANRECLYVEIMGEWLMHRQMGALGFVVHLQSLFHAALC